MDLQQIFSALYEALTSSEWLIVFGASLVLVAWLARKMASGLAKKLGLDKVAGWFNTKLGKYAVSFGTSLILTIGTSVMAGKGFSLSLITTGLAAAFTASGKWEGLHDALGYVLKKMGKESK